MTYTQLLNWFSSKTATRNGVRFQLTKEAAKLATSMAIEDNNCCESNLQAIWKYFADGKTQNVIVL